MRPTGLTQSSLKARESGANPGAGLTHGGITRGSLANGGLASPAEAAQHNTGLASSLTEPGVADARILRFEVAAYITQMCAELGAMARSSEFALLSYFLDMAAAEARESAGKLGPAIPDHDLASPHGRGLVSP